MSHRVTRTRNSDGAIVFKAVFSTNSGSLSTNREFTNIEKCEAYCNYLNGGDGLTKRERIAIAAMQCNLASNFTNESQSASDELCIAHWSVLQADALIAELEKQS